MRIAILSDTHGRIETTTAALELIQPYVVECIIHCGDIDDAQTAWRFPANTHFVYGNCDYDRTGIREAVEAIEARLHEPFGDLTLDGVRIAFTHSDDRKLFRRLQTADEYDFVFYGHTHVAAEHRVGDTRVINPGALHRAAVKSFVILDTETRELESVEVR